MPPKLEKLFEYAMTLARAAPEVYPAPAPVLDGMPSITLTLGFRDTVLAQLSQVSKLKLFCIDALETNDCTPQ